MQNLSGLARVVDPRNGNNLLAILISMAASGLWFWLRFDDGFSDAAWVATYAGLCCFLAWALARELDPDHPGPSLLAALLGACLPLAGDEFALLDTFCLLLALRIVNRSTGVQIGWIDRAVLLGLVGIASWRGSWVPGAVVSLAMILDGLLPSPSRRNLWLWLPAAAMAAVRFLELWPEGTGMRGGRGLPDGIQYLVPAAGAVFLVTLFAKHTGKSVGDMDGKKLSKVRVRAAQVLALVAAGLLVWEGYMELRTEVRLWSVLPLWSAFGAVGLFSLVALLGGHKRR